MKDCFEDILKEKLSQQQMTPPADGFLSLEAGLVPVLGRQRRKAVLYRAISMCAAACLIAALIIGGIQRKVQLESEIDYTAIIEQTPQQTVFDDILDQAKSIKPAQESTVMAKLSEEQPKEIVEPQAIPQTESLAQTTTQTNHSTVSPANNAPSFSYNDTSVDKRYTNFSLNNDNQYVSTDFVSSAKDKGWIADIFVGALASVDRHPFSSVSASATPSQFSLSETMTTRSENKTIDNYNHKFPITLGFNIGKRIGDGPISIESGLSYSYLESTAQMDATYNYRIKQQLHYIGVPLRANYSFGAPRGKFDFYISAGGTIEMAVSAKRTTDIYSGTTMSSSLTEDLKAKGPLLSAALNAGVAYDIMPRLGLFVEPGVSYYFRNSNHPITYRTDDNLKFNLRIGARTRF